MQLQLLNCGRDRRKITQPEHADGRVGIGGGTHEPNAADSLPSSSLRPLFSPPSPPPTPNSPCPHPSPCLTPYLHYGARRSGRVPGSEGGGWQNHIPDSTFGTNWGLALPLLWYRLSTFSCFLFLFCSIPNTELVAAAAAAAVVMLNVPGCRLTY